jgi:magnesium-transporting ATPase (P-type)
LLQFHQPLLYILLVAGLVKALLGSWTNALVIWAVTVINAMIGYIQEVWEASDKLLTDDNFSTIEAAVEEGRAVYLNLRKALAFVLPVNGGASMTILLGAVFGLELPVMALQVLWLNMVCSLTLSVPLGWLSNSGGLD